MTLREEFMRDKEIDPQQLDLAALTHTDIYFKWSERVIKARADAERAKLDLELTELRLQLRCRNNPAEFGLIKSTEAAVVAAAKATDEYETAFRKWVDAREYHAMLDKMVTALEHRKRMIEILVSLHGQQYFAGPHVPRDLVAAYQEYRKDVSEQVTTLQKSRARKSRRRVL